MSASLVGGSRLGVSMLMNSSGSDSEWKSSLLWYLLSDLGLEVTGHITLPKVFYRTARHLPQKTAILQKRHGVYRATNFSELLHLSEALAAALIHLGLKPGERIAMWLKNSLEWVVTDFGTMDAGGVTVPLYYTLTTSMVEEILRDSGASFLLVENEEKLEKILVRLHELPDLKYLVLKEVPAQWAEHPRVLTFEKLIQIGEENLKIHSEEITRRRETANYDDIATLIYTSGTTGIPKGVMLSHRNILSNVLSLLSVSEIQENDVALSVLPLAHAFERTVGYYLFLLTGATIAYAESFDTLISNLREIRPTICASVPRIFEKIFERTQKNLENSGRIKRGLFHWALKVGKEVVEARERKLSLRHPDRRVRHRPEDQFNHNDPKIESLRLRFKWAVAKWLVYNRFKSLLGGRLKYFVSGGAALPPEICRFFMNLDIYIYEGYGLTETSPVLAFNYRNKIQPGTVGKLLPWIQIKFGADGEICVKGPNVMKGYFNNPEATRQVLDEAGWFHTGDIGFLDENNYLHVTDRKKELIVMSNGKKVAPMPIEGLLNASPWVAQSVVVGNDRKFISALLVPEFPRLEEQARDSGWSYVNRRQLVELPEVHAWYDQIVHEVNQGLSPFEQIKRFKIMTHEFSPEAGEITPTQKVRRKVIEGKYGWALEEIYGDGAGKPEPNLRRQA